MSQLSGLFQFDSFSEIKLQELTGTRYPKVREKIEEYIKMGWLQYKNKQFSYTENGVFWGNNINAELLEVALSNSVN